MLLGYIESKYANTIYIEVEYIFLLRLRVSFPIPARGCRRANTRRNALKKPGFPGDQLIHHKSDRLPGRRLHEARGRADEIKERARRPT